jgi:hypothetical protein
MRSNLRAVARWEERSSINALRKTCMLDVGGEITRGGTSVVTATATQNFATVHDRDPEWSWEGKTNWW